jgi:hypothetical protein
MQSYQVRSVSFAIRPHRYEQDFYIGLFTMTAMYLVFGYLGNCKPIKPKADLSQFACTATYRVFILTVWDYSDRLCVWLFGQRKA